MADALGASAIAENDASGAMAGEQECAFEASRFYDLDSDGDGYIAQSEIIHDAQGPGKKLGAVRSVALYDIDWDEKLDLADFEKYWILGTVVDAGAVNFVELDMNADGLLDADELRALERTG